MQKEVQIPCKAEVFFIFSYPCNGRESIVLGTHFKNKDFDEFTRVDAPLNPKITFLAFALRVCVSDINIKNKLQQKHQIWYSTIVSYTDAIRKFS